MTGRDDDSSDMRGDAADDSAWDGEPLPVREFVAGLRGFADGAAPDAPLELEAVFAGVLPVAPRPRHRLSIGPVLTGAALSAVIVAAALSAVDGLPAPAQHMVSAVVSGLRPLHLVPAVARPSESRVAAPATPVRPPVDERVTELAALVAAAPQPVAVPQDLPAARRVKPAHPSHPAHPAKPARPDHPTHPAHPAHPVQPAHPVKPGHPAHPAHPSWAHGPR